MITREQLEKLCPRPAGTGDRAKNWDAYVQALIETGPALCAEFGIDLACELQHFLAQIAHESGGFGILWEDMKNYRPERIVEIFGAGIHSAKVTPIEARKLAGRAEALAERVYGLGNPKKAKELGNRDRGDGFKYRGYGPMQVTGRADHERLLGGQATPYAALRAAFREWDEKKCNELAARDDIKAITKRINGGYNGLDDRRAYLAKAKRIWPTFVADSGPRPPPASMLESTTGNTAVALGTGGTVSTATEVSTAMAKVASGGNGFSIVEFAIALAQSPTFWIGVFTVAGAAYVWLERRRKLVVHGI